MELKMKLAETTKYLKDQLKILLLLNMKQSLTSLFQQL